MVDLRFKISREATKPMSAKDRFATRPKRQEVGMAENRIGKPSHLLTCVYSLWLIEKINEEFN